VTSFSDPLLELAGGPTFSIVNMMPLAKTWRELLRRVMHNRSDQKVGQVAQRSPELVVEPLPASVSRHLGRQAGQKTTERLGPVALQGEDVLELVYDPFY
jgi:hypothetical protein